MLQSVISGGQLANSPPCIYSIWRVIMKYNVVRWATDKTAREMCPPFARFLKKPFQNCDFRNNPRLGASNTPFTRWLPAEYADGVSQPKGFNNMTVNNFILPLVRL